MSKYMQLRTNPPKLKIKLVNSKRIMKGDSQTDVEWSASI